MKQTLLLSAIVLSFLVLNAISQAQDGFTHRTVATDLVIPWEIEFGPDGKLWTTERIGLMSRIDIETGEKKVILDIREDVYNELETGMVGFTWHPDFADTPYVYVCYVTGTKEHFWRVVERFTYQNDTLTQPLEIFRLDPAYIFHQGCRLNILPDRKLYVTMGDSPHFDLSDVDSSVIGKILRMNLDGSVPDDNPIPGYLMYSKGHRNVQGFVRLPNGNIWSAEHGNAIEDEVNLVVPKGNYGWPYIEGVCDEEYEQEYCDTANVIEPKWSSGPTSTVAPCGLDYYDHERYPFLRNSLLLCTLKYSTLIKLELNEAGDEVVGEKHYLTRSIGRIRDVAIHPDGRIFVCTSNQEPNGYYPFPYLHDDRIVEIIPYEDCTGAEMNAPDTVKTKTIVDDVFRFAIPIENTGDCSMKINGVWTLDSESPLTGNQWRVPVMIPPGETYNLAALFSPTESGTFSGHLRIATTTQGNHDVFLVGSTTAGLLAPVKDSILLHGAAHSVSQHPVTYTNTGNDTLTIVGGHFAGSDMHLFELESFDPIVVAPGEVFEGTVLFSPLASGPSEASLVIESSSYRQYLVNVRGQATVSSVAPSEPGVLCAYPNPFGSQLYVVVPEGMETGTVVITDLVGSVLMNRSLNGESLLIWDGRSDNGISISSGVYYVSVFSDTERSSKLIQYLSR